MRFLGPVSRPFEPVLVSPPVWARLPGLRLVVVRVGGFDNQTPNPRLAAALAVRQAVLRRGWSSAPAHDHPHLACWRQMMRSIGVKPGKQPASIEALVRRALGSRRLDSINPLVDLYHVVSLRYLLPAGGWDLEALGARPALRFTDGGERFRALGAETADSVGAGELAYTAGRQVITRHFVWRQSERGKITAATRQALLVAEVPVSREPNLAERVRESFHTLIEQHFGVSPWTWILRG